LPPSRRRRRRGRRCAEYVPKMSEWPDRVPSRRAFVSLRPASAWSCRAARSPATDRRPAKYSGCGPVSRLPLKTCHEFETDLGWHPIKQPDTPQVKQDRHVVRVRPYTAAHHTADREPAELRFPAYRPARPPHTSPPAPTGGSFGFTRRNALASSPGFSLFPDVSRPRDGPTSRSCMTPVRA
jgi:hypothetical protein